jgi:hypothetical protein
LQEQHALEQTISKETSQEFQRGPTTSLSSLTPKQPPRKTQKQLGPIARQNELLKLACDALGKNVNDSTGANDEYIDIAKVWANKLRSLDPAQRRYAERAINEVLFEVESGTLHKNSVQINQGMSPQLTSPSSTSNHSSTHGTHYMPLVHLGTDSIPPQRLNRRHYLTMPQAILLVIAICN